MKNLIELIYRRFSEQKLSRSEALKLIKGLKENRQAKVVSTSLLQENGSDFSEQQGRSTITNRKAFLPNHPVKGSSTRASESKADISVDLTSKRNASFGTLMVQPVWKKGVAVPKESNHSAYAEHLVLLCEIENVSREDVQTKLKGVYCQTLQSDKQSSISECFEAYAVLVFEKIQTIIQARSKGKVLIQLVVPNRPEHHLFWGLLGLLKTAHLENPKIMGQIIEVNPAETKGGLLKKLQENSGCVHDAHIRYQDGKRYVRSFQEYNPETDFLTPALQHSTTQVPQYSNTPFKQQGVYLITGGAGGLGLIFAKEIASKTKNATLVLTGRSGLTVETQSELKKLKAWGVRVEYRQVDVTDDKALANLVQSIQKDFNGLDGIIHSAGILRDNFILNKTKGELKEVLAPKVSGVVNIDQACKNLSLDFFILFSSTSGVMGNIGQSDYSTANAFMDAYADYRNALVDSGKRQGRTLSINWPLWKEGGMSVDEATAKIMRLNTGMVAMQTAHGINAFYRALASEKSQVMVMEGDLSRIRRVFFDKSSEDSAYSIMKLPANMDKKTLKDKTLCQLKRFVGEVIRLSVDRIEAQEPLESYGIDSIVLTQLNQKLGRVIGKISKTLFFEYQTLSDMANGLVEDYPLECAKWVGVEHASSNLPPTSSGVVSVANEPSRSRQAITANDHGLSYSWSNDNAQEPIAIIGMSGRYPKAKNLEEYWELLKSGTTCITEISGDRWPLEGFFHPDPNKAATLRKSYCKWGSFLEDFDQFDPLFFNITPRDAESIDPQERLFLEESWKALEDAGYAVSSISPELRQRTGVFAGITKQGFNLYSLESPRQFSVTSFSSLVNRVSYVLNLQGPSIPIDTMCSSALVAIHEACEYIRTGRGDLAIAGGVNLYVHPFTYIGLSMGRLVSETSRSAAFTDKATGFVPGEAVGVVVLKPYAQALEDGDDIYALIRGSAVNHDGKTNSYTTPNPNQQATVIQEALARSGIDPRTISYIEAAANGSALGDAIEMTALTKTFASREGAEGDYRIGSVKPNIGHSESASGMSQLAKMILSLKHKMLVPTLIGGNLNSSIDFDKLPFQLQRDLSEWQPVIVDGVPAPRRAGVMGVGAGGVNAHLLMEEYIPQEKPRLSLNGEKDSLLFVLSAKNQDRLEEYVRQWIAYLKKSRDMDLQNLAYTLQVGRDPMSCRLAIVMSDQVELIHRLEEWPECYGNSNDCFWGDISQSKTISSNEISEATKAKNLHEIAKLWTTGNTVNWHELNEGKSLFRVAGLPTYPFARRTCWIHHDQNESANELNLAPKNSDNKAVEFYSLCAKEGTKEFQEEYLTFCPFIEKISGFSMTRVFLNPEEFSTEMAFVRAKQVEMRQVLFCEEDFGQIHTLLDIGCGHGTDVIQIASLYPHIQTHGFTITGDQAKLGNQRIAEMGLEDQSKIFHADSSKDNFPGSYDLIVGIEVTFHVRNKEKLFQNIASSLRDNGRVLLMDFTANLRGSIIDPRVEIIISTQDEWVDLLTKHHLVVDKVIDVSPQIANFLYDPELEQNIANLPEVVRNTLRNYTNQSVSLEKGWISYCLFKLNKDRAFNDSERREHNAFKLKHPTPYPQALEEMLNQQAPVPYPQKREMHEVVSPLLENKPHNVAQPKPDSAIAKKSLQDVFMEVLGLRRTELEGATFEELGIGSINVVALTEAINVRFDLNLPTSLVFECSTLNALAEYIDSKVRTEPPGLTADERFTSHVAKTENKTKEADLEQAMKNDHSINGGESPAHLEPYDRRAVSNDGIAVIGLSCRCAGADGPDEFWELVSQGRDEIREVERKDWLNFFEKNSSTEAPIRYGAIQDLECFDPLFFNISPNEAECMDPAQCILLEECYKALEDAGCFRFQLKERPVGTFIGTMGGPSREENFSHFSMLGNDTSILAARIAYYLDLKGPALAINTACSSSLVAIDLACQSLQYRKIDLAIAGGITVYTQPGGFVAMHNAGMLSPTGTCRPFDNAADGIVVGDGVGVVILKRLEQADRDNDRIYGIIRGSGTNQDGQTSGITVPSFLSQQQLEEFVYRESQICVEDIQYIEAHGTATKLGDPIEIHALNDCFQKFTKKKKFCAIGSLKANIGHTAAAAGVLGLIKVILSLKNKKMAPSINFEQPNQHIDFENGPFFVNQSLRDWPVNSKESRLAAVSSFGFSGTNAHVVIEGSHENGRVGATGKGNEGEACVVVLSARNEERLREAAKHLHDYLLKHTQINSELRNIAYTLQVARMPLEERLGVIVDSVDELIEKLEKFLENKNDVDGFFHGQIRRNKDTFAVFDGEEELQEIIEKWVQHKKFSKLLNLWIKGLDFDWNRLYKVPGPYLVSLPTYPFAKKHFGKNFTLQKQMDQPSILQAGEELQIKELKETYPETIPSCIRNLKKHSQEALEVEFKEKSEINLENGELEKELLIKLLWGSLASLDLFKESHVKLSDFKEKTTQLNLDERWFEESFRILVSEGYLQENGENSYRVKNSSFDLNSLWNQWDDAKRCWMQNAKEKAQINLVEATVRALPDILKGKKQATDVMFPNSSMHLVEGVYKGNVVADYFNKVLGNSIVAYVQERIARDPSARIRLLEIGAGTGGTTAGVLMKLRPFQDNIAEYCYTDLSKAFLMHAEEVYTPENPYVTTQIFDVEKAIREQNILANHYDLVIAANVLHATKDIRNTLRNTKAPLRNRGLLLLNEVSDKSLFGHLTFALLEGWWLYEDLETRVPGSPALYPQMWKQVLEEEGFQSVYFPAEKNHELGQQIVIAESNGIVRQMALNQPAQAEFIKSQQRPTQPNVTGGISNVDNAKINKEENGLIEQASYNFVRETIIEKLATLLKMETDEIDVDDSFSSFGVDSILGVKFVDTINQTLNVEMQTIDLFDYNSVNQVTKHILSTFEEMISVPFTSPSQAYDNGKSHVQVVAKENVIPRHARSKPLSTARDNLGTPIQSTEPKNEDIKREPIAIIGMSGRFAKSKNVHEFWEHLAQGHDLVEKTSRWDFSHHMNGEKPEGFCDYGSFLDDIDKFDPLFFKISGIEATYMDPQQRFFLEESWKALEDAGYAGESMKEKRCGIYVGCATGDYLKLFSELPPAQALWNNSDSLVPARIAYYLNLKGPAVALDTACSSSLVAIHMACQALWIRETECALAGGVFMQFTPDFFIMANRAGMLSPSGRCFTFDDRADGFVPGEGVGVVMLKRLDEAITDRDHIYGVIRGSGINQDGNTNGITAPSAKSQEYLEREVYDRFEIHPETIQMVEAHGTGTALGDPIEYEALRRAFRYDTKKEAYCALGSVKTNIGHAAPAAGIAGILKVLLSLQNKAIPPSLNYENGNPAVGLEKSPFYVNTTLKNWTVKDGAVRRAAISGFGWSGTNAHIVIEEAPQLDQRHPQKPGYLIVISAKTAEQLRCQVENFLNYCKKAETIDLGNISYTLLMGRSHLDHRLACVTRNPEEVVGLLGKWLEKGNHSSIYFSELNPKETREQVSLKRFGNHCVEECQTTSNSNQYLEHLSTLADLYIQGYRLNFGGLFSEGYCRVSLPTYPFTKERYWVENKEGTKAQRLKEPKNNNVLHPLVHENTSSLEEQRFSSTFTGEEFFFADHVVMGKRILPGVAYLEMARAAVEQASIPLEKGKIEIQLKDIVWVQPIEVHNDTKEVHIGLIPKENGQIQYQVYTENFPLSNSANNRDAEDASNVHSQGVAKLTSAEKLTTLDLEALQKKCDQGRLTFEQCYDIFKTAGVDYGPGHKGMEEAYLGEDRVLAKLSLPSGVVGARDGFVMHPSLMDSALQASIGLMRGSSDHKLTLPFALDQLEIYRPYTARMWALIQYKEGSSPESHVQKFDIHLCDEQGNICVRMNGFSFRVFEKELDSEDQTHECSSETRTEMAENSSSRFLLNEVSEYKTHNVGGDENAIESWVGLTMMASEWNALAPPPTRKKVLFPLKTAQVVIAGGTKEQQNALQKLYPSNQLLAIYSEDSIQKIVSRLNALKPFDHIVLIAPERPLEALTEESIINQQNQGVLLVFHLIKALLALGYGSRELAWTVITIQTQHVRKKDVVNPTCAGIHGLVGALAKEYPNWKLRLLDLETGCDWPIDEMFTLPADAQGDALAYRGREWFQQGLIPVREIAVTDSPYRSRGVYVVIGGAGGIGEVWSRAMIQKYDAQIIWIGRRKKDKAIQAKLDALAQIGRIPNYLQADARDLESMQKAYSEIKQTYPEIHGVIHSAIVLLDKSLANMDEERFQAGLSAKVNVSVRLAQVFQKEALDFVLFFSSMQSFTKSPGQSNYAAGCTFKDAFAKQLAKDWSCAVKIVNWGYWGSVGIVVDPTYKDRMAHAGIGSIEPEEGMDTLARLLQGPMDQISVIKTLRPGVMEGLLTEEWIKPFSDVIPSRIESLRKPLAKQRLRVEAMQSALGLQSEVMQDLILKLLLGSLQSLNLLKRDDLKLSDSKSKPKLLSLYNRWFEESCRVLKAKGYLPVDRSKESAKNLSVDLETLWSQWDEAKLDLMEDKNKKAQVVLIEACLRGLPEVLTGKRKATDVMFSNSSMELVGGVYKGNAISDYYNEIMGNAVVAYCQERLAQDSSAQIRLLEIGAGTGATTSALLPRLGPFHDNIQEYCYTDISKVFLIHAEEHYAPENPYLVTHIFDVSKPLSGQGIQADYYDIVIATNVLHATRNIRQSLRNAKAGLRKYGLLLVNELSMNTLFNHLTFGLLEGWWLYDDEALRMTGCPGLTPETWAAVLEEEGFHNTLFPAQVAHEWGQQIIVTESDGIIRQRQPPSVKQRKKALQETKASSEPATGKVPVEGNTSASLYEKSVLYLKKLVASTLKIPSHQIEVSRPLEEYGLDSILVVQLTNVLSKVFKNISSTLFFEVQTLDALVDHLINTQKEVLIEQVGGVTQEVGGQALLSKAPSNFDSGRTTSRRFMSLSEPKRLHTVRTHLEKEHSDSRSFSIQDVAIIGLSGRYPQAKTIYEFWNNLKAGKNCITEIPYDRWDWKCYFDTEKGKPGSYYTRWGGFLEDVDKFDPLFCRISPKEAERMDPQERLFLEVAYSSIEDAGYTSATLCASRKVGVFVGVMNSTYGVLTSYWSIANRISYLLNFQGPSIAVDTACSASLTAIHLALESLYSGMSECAIAGGVNLILHPVQYLGLSAATMLSSGSQCKTFGDQADGFVDAEGVGAVVLKPLPKAIADRDHIYGNIKGSMLNAGGKTNGYTVPNPHAQRELIVGALERAGVHPRTVSYLEAHGTGTVLGDPIEISGLTRAFEQASRDKPFQGAKEKQYCPIGSVKSNMGHAESAAGIAGLTKVLLQMNHAQLVPSLHAEVLNPNINFEETPFIVQQQLEDWKRPTFAINGDTKEYPRIGGVSSFGAGGANAHVIIEEYLDEKPESRNSKLEKDHPSLIVLSAKNEDRLKEVAKNLYAYLTTPLDPRPSTLHEVAYTLQVGREAMKERLGLIVGSVEELVQKLMEFLENRDDVEYLFRGQVKRRDDALAVFTADEDLQTAIEVWVSKGKYSKLMDLWVKGLQFDWNTLYNKEKPRRISLPTYPFKRERYWISDFAVENPNLKSQTSNLKSSWLHPFVHENVSTIKGPCFRSTFCKDDFFFKDCEIKRQNVVPGIALLEMAQAAIKMAVGDFSKDHQKIELRKVVWGKPISVGETIQQVYIELFPGENREIDYEIYTDDSEDAVCVHSQGNAKITVNEQTPSINLTDLQTKPNQTRFTSQAFCQVLDHMGIDHGPAYQELQEIYVGGNEVLAKLKLPAFVLETKDQFTLRPNLLDSALHASLGLGQTLQNRGNGNNYSGRLMPARLESLEIFDSCSESMWAWVRYADGSAVSDGIRKLDIDLCDEDGKVCAKIRELAWQSEQSSPTASVLHNKKQWLFVKEEWIPESTPDDLDWKDRLKQYGGKKIYVVYSEEDDQKLFCSLLKQLEQTGELSEPFKIETLNTQNIDEHSFKEAPDVILFLGPTGKENQQNQSVESDLQDVFRLSQSLMKNAWNTSIRIYYLYGGVPSQPRLNCEALAGFLKSAMLENNQHVWKCIGVYDNDTPKTRHERLLQEWLIDKIDNKSTALFSEVRYEEPHRLVPKLVEANLEPSLFAAFRSEASYIITGGFGPVGELLCEALAKRYQSTLVILSRGEWDNTKQVQCEKLRSLGSKVYYHSVDISDRVEFQKAYARIKKEVGAIHGVIHLARLVEDELIVSKSWESFQRVIQAKVQGTLNLDKLTANEPLDFFMLFSSMAAFGIRGSSDYGYSSAFQNVFARYRNQLQIQGKRSGPAISQCWGAWTVDKYVPENRDETLKSVGFDLIDIESALPFIEASCACNGGVIGLMAILDSEKIRSWMGLESHSRISPEEPSWDTLEAQIEKWEQLKQKGENISIATVNKVIKSENVKKLSPLLVERIYSLLFSENGRKSSQTFSVQPDKKDDIGHIICEALSEVMGLNKVDENEVFQNYGLESVSAMRLSFTLGQKIGREVRPEWLIDYPSVRALSKRIEREKHAN